jgi:hypothetical protein
MSTFRSRWFLCGGWAVDAWLGRETREHHDVDVAIFEHDQLAIREHLPEWQLVGHDDNWSGENPIFPNVPIVPTELWDGRRLELPGHVHARAADGFEFELNLNEIDHGDWVFSGEPRIALPLERCVHQSAWGIPAVTPEVIVYYKALPPRWRDEPRTPLREHDERDFATLLPDLTEIQREWLRESISLIEPRHPWLARLSS